MADSATSAGAAGATSVGAAGAARGADVWTSTRLFMRHPSLAEIPPLPEPPAGYVLRGYQPVDGSGLAALLTRAFGEAWDEARVRRDLAETPDVEQIYLIAYHDKLVATASARLLPDEYPGSGYVHWVGADPAHQGKGLGRLVSLRLLHHFRAAGLRDAVLETNGFRLPAVRTYLRLGFVPERHYGDADEQRRWSRLLPQIVR